MDSTEPIHVVTISHVPMMSLKRSSHSHSSQSVRRVSAFKCTGDDSKSRSVDLYLVLLCPTGVVSLRFCPVALFHMITHFSTGAINTICTTPVTTVGSEAAYEHVKASPGRLM